MENLIWDVANGDPTILTLPGLEQEFEIKLTPQDGAMLCALYSRSQKSSRDHAKRIAKEGSSKFMSGAYVGYAHKSIADCGSTTVFSERISILAAKALEDTPMFSGQETSTRYIDFNEMPLWEPTGHEAARRAIRRLMDFYRRLEQPLFEMVAGEHPFVEGQDREKWENAIRARAFDIRRAFLPAGAATQVGWHGNLRQLADHLLLLRHHPLEEVRSLANGVWAALRRHFEASFPESAAMLDVSGERAKGRIEAVEAYRRKVAQWMWGDFAPEADEISEGFHVIRDGIDLDGRPDSELVYELLAERPQGAGLPQGFGEFGVATFQKLIDMGSYRDLHRQRRGFWRMPVVTARLGFERWYLENLPPAFLAEAEQLIEEVRVDWEIVSAAHGVVDAQYMVALGFRVPWRYTCGLPQVLYMAELRASKTVHATARFVGQDMARYVQGRWPWLSVHADFEEDSWTLKRGGQTIKLREET